MALSRKHYTAVAKILADEKQNWSEQPEARMALAYVTSALASYFASENQTFDRARFIEAAGGGLQ